jgi:hypothetical protein
MKTNVQSKYAFNFHFIQKISKKNAVNLLADSIFSLRTSSENIRKINDV